MDIHSKYIYPGPCIPIVNSKVKASRYNTVVKILFFVFREREGVILIAAIVRNDVRSIIPSNTIFSCKQIRNDGITTINPRGKIILRNRRKRKFLQKSRSIGSSTPLSLDRKESKYLVYFTRAFLNMWIVYKIA